MADDSVELNPLTCPPILRTIFWFLPAKSLCRVASVCSLWKSQAEVTLRQRRQYCWQLFEALPDDRPQEADFDEVVINRVQQYFEAMPLRPTTVLMFTTTTMWNRVYGKFRKRRRALLENEQTFMQIEQAFAEALPATCQLWCTVTDGIIGTTSDLSCTKEREKKVGVSLVCFGEYPGLKISQKKGFGGFFDSKHNVAHGQPRSGEPEPAKLYLMMFPVSSNTSYNVELVKFIHRQIPDALIAGGVVNCSFVKSVATAPEDADYVGDRFRPFLFGRKEGPLTLVFQSTGMQVACVKLDQTVSKEKEVDQVIRQLKEKTRDFRMERSLAFMFACVAKGYHLYRKYNVESSVFRRHFPSTPLLGFFGNGEVGSEYPYPEDAEPIDFNHAYVTFMVVVSLP